MLPDYKTTWGYTLATVTLPPICVVLTVTRTTLNLQAKSRSSFKSSHPPLSSKGQERSGTNPSGFLRGPSVGHFMAIPGPSALALGLAASPSSTAPGPSAATLRL